MQLLVLTERKVIYILAAFLKKKMWHIVAVYSAYSIRGLKFYLISKISQPSHSKARRLSTVHQRGAPCQSIVFSFNPACLCLSF